MAVWVLLWFVAGLFGFYLDTTEYSDLKGKDIPAWLFFAAGLGPALVLMWGIPALHRRLFKNRGNRIIFKRRNPNK